MIFIAKSSKSKWPIFLSKLLAYHRLCPHCYHKMVQGTTISSPLIFNDFSAVTNVMGARISLWSTPEWKAGGLIRLGSGLRLVFNGDRDYKGRNGDITSNLEKYMGSK